MKNPLMLIGGIIAAGLLYNVLPFTLDVYRRFRYRKVVTCPETAGLAEVELKASRAAFTALFRRPELRVKSCTLWPGKRGCEQGCVNDNWRAEYASAVEKSHDFELSTVCS